MFKKYRLPTVFIREKRAKLLLDSEILAEEIAAHAAKIEKVSPRANQNIAFYEMAERGDNKEILGLDNRNIMFRK